MFPVKHVEEALQRAAGWAGLRLAPEQLDRLTTYADWLIVEALPAGGVGPEETDRIVDRHVADSLVFAVGWAGGHPEALIDVGSGVGLPGIPLAIAFPEASVRLLDRSQRRIDLAARASRILGLSNVEAVRGEIEGHPHRYDGATFRGSLKPAVAVAAARRLLVPGGTAVIGLSRGDRPDAVPETGPGVDVAVLETPDGVLDSPAWILRMTAT